MQLNSNQRVAWIAAALSSFLTPFMGSSINIALPAIGREFSHGAPDAVLLGWVATSYMLAAAMFLVPLGRISDIYGRKRIFTYGVFLYTLGALLCALAPSGIWLILFRVVQGTGGAMIFGTSIAILTSVFPPGERGRVLGLTIAATYLGLSLGPVLGGMLTHAFGWRSIFWVNVPLGLSVIVLVLWKLKGEWAEAAGEPFDWFGSCLYSASLVMLMNGFTRLPSWLGLWLLLGSLAGVALFVRWDMRHQYPIMHVSLFTRNRVFAFSNLAAVINYSATFALTFLLSLYLQYIKGLSPQQAGGILIAQPLVMAVFSPYAGRLSDRIESQIVASIGMALTCAGLLLLSFLTAGTSLIFIVACLLLLGLGFALFSSPNTNAVMGSVERRFYGVASATLGTMRLTGQMLSMGISMLIIAVVMSQKPIIPANYAKFMVSTRIAFAVFAILCFGGIFASLARGSSRTN